MTEAADAAPPESGDAPRPRRRRSPVIDVAVILFGGYLLTTMFGDVRYFLQGGTPRDLGDATALAQTGLGDDLAEKFVTVRGTPDVQHAARAKIGDKTIGYLRLVEGGGSLFAALPRSGPTAPNQFEGEFTGRLRRLRDVRMFAWIQQYFDGERIVETRDLTREQLLAALDAGSLGDDRQVSLGVDQPDARVQLGRTSFPARAAAEAAVQALGFPYYFPEDQSSAAFYTVFARIPEAQRAAAQASLVQAGVPAASDKPDPRVGALVVPFTTTYLVPAGALKKDGGQISLAYGDNTTSPGFVLEGDKLVPRPLKDGRLTVDPAQLRAVGVVQQVRVDPNGFIVLVGETPRDQWPALALWVVVLGVVGWNIAGLALLWRRKRA